MELRAIRGRLDLKDLRDSLVELELLEQWVSQVSRVPKVLQAALDRRVLSVSLEILEIQVFRVHKDLVALQVSLDFRDLSVLLALPARVDKKDGLAVKERQASEETPDPPEQLEQPEILVCILRSLVLFLKFFCFDFIQYKPS